MIIEGKIFPYRKKFEKIMNVASEVLGEDFSRVSVSINFVSEQEIQKLNLKFRGVDKVTDVLSFPNLDKKADQKLSEFSKEIFDDTLFLGDVVICKSVAKSQAKEFGHDLRREICFLALHGVLHLLGYDHVEKQDEKIMQKTAEEILTRCGVTR